MADTPPTNDDSPLDFSAYNLEQLAEDIQSLVNIPGAVAQTAKIGFSLPFIIGALTWIIFSPRMGLVFIPFLLIAFLLALFASLVIGVYFLARKRLDTVVSASTQIVDVIGEMHHDIESVRSGHEETSIQAVAVGLLEGAIMPVVFHAVTGQAATAMGPLGAIASKLTRFPLRLVERSVVSAVEALPDRKIGDAIDTVGAGLPDTEFAMAELDREYDELRGKMESIVGGVSRAASGSILVLSAISAIPLLLWWLLGWLLT